MNLPTAKAYVPESRAGYLTDLAAQPRFLFPLKLLAPGTPDVEAISSYASRLATEHGVGVRQLAFLLPRVLKTLKLPSLRNKDMYTMNGIGQYASELTDLLRGATQQANLILGSLSHLRGVLSPVKAHAVRKYRRWCPSCLSEMRESGTSPFARLIWQLQQAEYCDRHGTKLRERCSECGAKQSQVCGLVPLDRCVWCEADLCSDLKAAERVSSVKANEIAWINKTLAELILAGNTPLEIADNAFCRFIKAMVESQGSDKAVAKFRGYSRATITQWARSRCRPTLGTFLDICAKANVPASLILREPLVAVTACQELDFGKTVVTFSFCRQAMPRCPRIKRDHQLIYQRARRLLETLPKGMYVSHEEFAERLKLPYGTLHYFAARVFRTLNRRNYLIRRSAHGRSQSEALRLVEKICDQIQDEGGKISRNLVVQRARAEKSRFGRGPLLAAYSLYRRSSLYRDRHTRRCGSSATSTH